MLKYHPDYSPAGILCPGGNCESSAKPHWCWVSDLCPFGFEKPATSWVADSVGYRYGFNNMEKDDEIKGSGNSYDFGARIYDPRVGRWLAVDPYSVRYPFLSTYTFVKNSPVTFLDPDGKQIYVFFEEDGQDAFISLMNDIFVNQVKFCFDYQANGDYILTFNFQKDGNSEQNLFLVQQAIYSYLKEYMIPNESNHQKSMFITISGKFSTDKWGDEYVGEYPSRGIIYPKHYTSLDNPFLAGLFTLHFFVEQGEKFNSQTEFAKTIKNPAFNDAYLFYHNKAISFSKNEVKLWFDGNEVYNKGDRIVRDFDIINSNNEYLYTLRVDYNKSDYSYTIFNRAKEGTEYSKIDFSRPIGGNPPTLNTIEKRKQKHLSEYPID